MLPRRGQSRSTFLKSLLFIIVQVTSHNRYSIAIITMLPGDHEFALHVIDNSDYDWLSFPFWKEALEMSTFSFMLFLSKENPQLCLFVDLHFLEFCSVLRLVQQEFSVAEDSKTTDSASWLRVVKSSTGRPFWYNVKTGVSTFTPPRSPSQRPVRRSNTPKPKQRNAPTPKRSMSVAPAAAKKRSASNTARVETKRSSRSNPPRRIVGSVPARRR